jgi:hypothetical protein
MDEDIPPDYQDMAREYPAVRCRECDTITHVCTANGIFGEYTCSTCVKKRQPCPHTARIVQTRNELKMNDGWKLATANHRKGCSKPPSRLALLMMLQDQAPELDGSELEGRLLHYMTEGEVKRAAAELLRYLNDR